MLRLHSSLALVAVSLVTMGVVACSDDESSGSGTTPAPTATTTTPPPAGDTASVRVVHASPDAPAVDVYVEGQSTPVVKGAKFGDTSPYVTVPPGKYNFQIRPAGADAASAPVYSTGALDVPAKAKITAVAAGLLAGTADADKFRVLALAEGFKTATDKATVRVVHASADAPTVGVDVGNDNPAAPEVPSLARFADTGADGVQLPAGQALQIGIAAGGARVTAFTTPSLPAGGEVFVIATGLVGKLPREADGFSLLAVGPTGSIGFIKQNPTVYALHASPDAPAVDIFAGDAELADNLAFGQISQPIQVPPGSYTLDFFATAAGSARPAGAAAASKPSGALEAGNRYLVAATGFLVKDVAADKKFQLAAAVEGFDLSDPSKVALRAMHASPDAPAVDIGVIGTGSITPVFTNATFPNATDPKGTLVAPATLPIGITPTGQNNNIVAGFTVPTAAGVRAIAVAAGALAPSGSEQSFRLLVVDTKPTPWTVTAVNPNTI